MPPEKCSFKVMSLIDEWFLRRSSIRKVIGDLAINWLTRIVMLKSRMIHFEGTHGFRAYVNCSIQIYFFTLKGPTTLNEACLKITLTVS